MVPCLCLSCGTVQVKDEQWCSPIPGVGGAACDWFLHSHQEIKTAEQWSALQAQWGVIECTSAQTVGDLKGEVEKLCSEVKCTEEVKQTLLQGLERIKNLRTN